MSGANDNMEIVLILQCNRMKTGLKMYCGFQMPGGIKNTNTMTYHSCNMS